jgi:HSP20 family protein
MNTPSTAREGSPAAAAQSAMLPPVDVVEDAAGITLYADLPGVGREQLHVRVDGDQLGIEAEMLLPVSEGLAPVHAEVTRRRFERTFTLSKELDPGQVSAELSHGVLRVRIPKAAHAQPRRVEVRVA